MIIGIVVKEQPIIKKKTISDSCIRYISIRNHTQIRKQTIASTYSARNFSYEQFQYQILVDESFKKRSAERDLLVIMKDYLLEEVQHMAQSL